MSHAIGNVLVKWHAATARLTSKNPGGHDNVTVAVASVGGVEVGTPWDHVVPDTRSTRAMPGLRQG